MLGFWISLVIVSQGFEYASDSKCKGSEYGKVANIRELRRVLNKPEYFKKYLNMRGYALIKVNMFEYAWKYQNKQILNMPEFWTCLMQYIAWGHFTKYWAVIEIEIIQNIVKHLRWSVLHKE